MKIADFKETIEIYKRDLEQYDFLIKRYLFEYITYVASRLTLKKIQNLSVSKQEKGKIAVNFRLITANSMLYTGDNQILEQWFFVAKKVKAMYSEEEYIKFINSPSKLIYNLDIPIIHKTKLPF